MTFLTLLRDLLTIKYTYEVRFSSIAPHFARLILIIRRPQRLSSPRGSRGEPQGREGAIGRRRLPVGRWCIMRYTGITGIIRITRITSIIRTYVRPRKNRPGHDGSFFLRFPSHMHLSFSPFPRLHLSSATSSSFPACTGLTSSSSSIVLLHRATHPLLSLTYSLPYLSSVIFLP